VAMLFIACAELINRLQQEQSHKDVYLRYPLISQLKAELKLQGITNSKEAGHLIETFIKRGWLIAKRNDGYRRYRMTEEGERLAESGQ
jgi:hypothetical protein